MRSKFLHQFSKRYRELGFYLSFFLILTSLNAQKPLSFERFTVIEGLISNSVTKIFQDSRGYLWVGSTNGVCRYDGYHFKEIKLESDIQTTAGTMQVFQIFEDTRGQICIATEVGLFVYDQDTEELRQYLVDPGTGGPRNIIVSLMETGDGRLLCGGVGQPLFVLDSASAALKPLDLPEMTRMPVPGNYVALMDKDQRGRIWMANWQYGLISFAAESDSFTQMLPESKTDPDFRLQMIWALKADPRGWLWIGDLKGIYKYFPDENRIAKLVDLDIRFSGNGPRTFFNDFAIDHNGDVWLPVNNHALYLFKNGSDQPYAYPLSAAKKGLRDYLLNAAYVDQFNILWLGTNARGLMKFDIDRDYFNFLQSDPQNPGSISGNYIFSFYPDPRKKDVYWLGFNDGGLNRIDMKTMRVRKYLNKRGHPGTISSNSIRSIYRDDRGDIWLGTWGQGIDIMDARMRKKKNILLSQQPQSAENNVRAIRGDGKGNIWIGTIGGMFRYNGSDRKIVRIPDARSMPFPVDSLSWLKTRLDTAEAAFELTEIGDYADTTLTFTADSGSFFIVALGEGRLGEVMFDYGWLTDEDGKEIWSMENPQYTLHDGGDLKNRIRMGLVVLDRGKYTLHYKSDDSHSFGRFNAAPPSDSSWWGISAYPVSSNLAAFIGRFTDPDVINGRLQGQNISHIEVTDANTVWISTLTNGLSRFDYRTGKFENFQHDIFSPSLSRIKHFAIAGNGVIWEASDAGLVRFDVENLDVRVFTTEDGLPVNFVESVIIDNGGDIWMGTQSGLCRMIYNDSTGNSSVVRYDTRDGLLGNDYVFNVAAKNEKGELFFGAQNGLDYFYPPKRNLIPPRVLFSSFLINGQNISEEDIQTNGRGINHLDQLTLAYNQNNLEFEFIALHFSRPEKNSYKYRLQGFNDEWLPGNRRYVSFTNLAPGNYTFEVKAANSDGVWSKNGKSLEISILPPWWKTTSAYISYVLLFIFAFVSVDRLQRSRIREREREAAAIREAELRAHAAELQAKASEAQNRALQAESERKTKELEDARKLQLSMLPKELPQISGLDIAAIMHTATEVGGDYYDFIISDKGSLTVAFGDAAGHGTKAGIMVAMLKTLFSAETGEFDIAAFANKCNRTFRNTNMEKILVGLSLLRIEKDRVFVTVAGMPPLFIYRHKKKNVEELLMDAPPMGAFAEYHYQEKSIDFHPGDALVLLSDGLPEQKNSNGEELGYPMIEKCIIENGEKDPNTLMNNLKDLGDAWSRTTDPEDDITILVIKKN